MKNVLKIVFISAFLAGFISCKEDETPVFDGQDNIYFQFKRWTSLSGNFKATLPFEGSELSVQSNELQTKSQDSMVISTAFVDLLIRKDTTFVPVMVSGRIVDFDRDFSYRIDSTQVEGAAVSGTHYNILRAFIPANKNLGGIVVEINRDALEGTELRRIDFSLHPNEYFNVLYDSIPRSKTDETKVLTLRQSLYFTDGLTQPKDWNDYYLGSFSTAKAFLLHDELGISWDDLYGSPDRGWWMGVGNALAVWLRDYKAANNGNFYKDDDDKEMKSGTPFN